jgi:non-homologous end joining protein Ku
LADREYFAAIFGHDGVLSAELLRFHDQVRAADFLGAQEQAQAAAVKRYRALIDENERATFDPSTLHNTHNEALRELAARKAKNKQAVITSPVVGHDAEGEAPVETVDLMRILKQSLRG